MPRSAQLATIIAALISSIAGPATAQSAVDVSGLWTGEWCYRPGVGFPGEVGQCYSAGEVILEQNDDRISGAIREPNSIPPRFRSTNENVEFFISNIEGSITNDRRIAWVKTHENVPSMGTRQFEGRVSDDGNSIVGRWIAVRNYGPLRLRRVEEQD
jgi:hypothetical protein